MARTILTIKEQNEWLDNHNTTLIYKWSCRGFGNSKILKGGRVIGKAKGCDSDLFGTALGRAITTLFGKEVYKLAKRECKGKNPLYKSSYRFWGLFFDSVNDKAYLDGGCGKNCMRTILNKIGFSLNYIGETKRTMTGETFYTLGKVTKYQRKWI